MTASHTCSGTCRDSDPVGAPHVLVCDTKVGRGVPLLETREKSHFMRIEEHEWAICREQLIAGFESDAAAAAEGAAS